MTSSSKVSPIMTNVGGEQVNSSTKANTRIAAEILDSCSVFSLYSFITSGEGYNQIIDDWIGLT